MTVRMNEFGREPEELRAAELSACDRVLRSAWWILGREVSAFEEAWAKWIGVTFSVGCGNGLDALEIGLRALGISSGDEVITTPMTAFATVLGILRAGATPVLADIDPVTAMLDPKSVKRCMTKRTRAVVLVHLYGRIGPVEELLELTKTEGIFFVEDCAQAHGARLDGRSAGTFGDLGAWSFYPTKNLGAIGDGGAVTTWRPEIAAKARCFRNYGQTERYHHSELGMNSRLDEIQAALLQERLRYLEKWVERRREIAQRYTLEFRNPAVRTMDLPRSAMEHAHHLFVVKCRGRVELQVHLRERDIESLIHYPIPVHMQAPCSTLTRDPAGLNVAETHADECLSIPCHPAMSDIEVEQVITAVNDFGV